MTKQRIGVAVAASDSNSAIAAIEDLEQRGIPASWVTSGSAGGGDGLGVLAGAAARTQRIMLGTAVMQTFTRHPVAMAQQALVVAQIAPGRFRLGMGTSGRSGMEQTVGADFRSPLAHLREYIGIEKALLQQGLVDHNGRYYRARSRISGPVEVPVMAAALGATAYGMCGAVADGAISWVCPGAYLRDVALPAMKLGAESAGRPVPPLIAQVPVCVHDNLEEAREAVRRQFGGFARAPFYQNMFAAAGFPEVTEGIWSDAMVDAVAVYGDEDRVSEGLKGLFSLGATEIMASPVAAGEDNTASVDRALKLLAQLGESAMG